MSANPALGGHDRILAAEYVAGLLEPAERQSFQLRLNTEPALRDEVRFWEERLMPLTDEIASLTPPKSVLTSIENRIFPQAATSTSWTQSLFFWRSLSIASLAAFALAAALYVGAVHNTTNPPTQTLVAELSGPQQLVKLAVLYDSQKGEIKFNRVSGAPVSGRDFELWLIEGKNAPVSLGVLPAQTSGIIKVSDTLKSKLASSVLAISDEPQGGSPTGQPTGQVLATGAMNSI